MKYCLVCAARGIIIEAVHPKRCTMTGNNPAMCPICPSVTAIVGKGAAIDTRKAFRIWTQEIEDVNE